MRCPNRKCGRETGRLLIKFDKQGRKYEGCAACLPPIGTPNVRTGKKVWAGSEVYTKEQLDEKNHAFFERVATRAAENRRRHWRPSEIQASERAVREARQ